MVAVETTLPTNAALGTWQVAVEINGTELARDSFQVTAAGAGAAHVVQGSTYVANGRTTPIDFGTVALNGTLDLTDGTLFRRIEVERVR